MKAFLKILFLFVIAMSPVAYSDGFNVSSYLFSGEWEAELAGELATQLSAQELPQQIIDQFQQNGITLSANAQVTVQNNGLEAEWIVNDTIDGETVNYNLARFGGEFRITQVVGQEESAEDGEEESSTTFRTFNPGEHLDKGIERFTEAIIIGSYGGYWSLNDYFESLLSAYFDEAQMIEIDRQLQEMAGIADLGYNYSEAYGSGNYYDIDSGDWEYGGGRKGKHYSCIANTAFVVDATTGNIIDMTASTDLTGGMYNSFDSNLTGTDATINDKYYKVLGARNWSPIIIDLNGDDKPDTNRNIWTPHAPKFFGERKAIFDMSGDGRVDLVEWPGYQDGLLVLPEKDGTVKDANNLFGTAGGYKDGYQKMAKVLDLDGDGWVQGDELSGLFIWRDRNGNAKAEQDEMVTVQSLGIEKISTSHKNFRSVCYINGKKVTTWDWWPSGYELMEKDKP